MIMITHMTNMAIMNSLVSYDAYYFPSPPLVLVVYGLWFRV